jgi:hypothetical protein
VSWNCYAGPLDFEPLASRELASWCVLGHGLALAAALSCGPGTAAVLLVLAAFAHSLRRAIRPLGPGVVRLRFTLRNGWERELPHGVRIPMELADSTVVTRAAVFLHFRTGGSPYRAMILRDSLSPDDWRRLRVLARFCDGAGPVA